MQGLSEVFIILVLIFFNALFVATEYAIVRVRKTELDALIKKGNSKAKLTKKIISDLNKYISAIQLGITILNLLLGWIGEDIFIQLLKPVFQLFNISGEFVETLSVIIGLLIITFFTVSVGEIAPKSIALKIPLKIALWFSYPLNIFYLIFKPFIWLLNGVSKIVLRLVGIKPVSDEEMYHSEEEIREIIHEGKTSGIIDSTEHQLIEKIFNFNDKTVNEIMVPRNNIFALSINESKDTIIGKVIEEGYSRIPIYNDTIDNIVGIIYSKQILNELQHKNEIILQNILQPVHFVPENKHIGELLKELQKRHIHMGIVVNEHGGVEGLVTMEDILEEIVGEIEDEFDVTDITVESGGKNVFLVKANIPIKDFNRKFTTDIPEDNHDYLTLSGFILKVTGHIPSLFERIDYKGIVMTVIKKSGNRLIQIKIQK